MTVEFRDLKAQYNKYKTEIDSAIQEVLNNTNFIGGKEVNVLEELRGGDYGDVPVIPGYILQTYKNEVLNSVMFKLKAAKF